MLLENNPVAACFSRAAASYDSAAQLQRDVGYRLLQLCPAKMQAAANTRPARWLDLGCGTGYFSQQLARQHAQANGYALDLSRGMLQHARQQRPVANYLCGDAQALPLANSSFDLIFSNMALQWCSNFSQVLSEAKRILKPGAIFAFSSVIEGSLHELKKSWQTVDTDEHVNRFRHAQDYVQLCQNSGLQPLVLHSEAFCQYFPSVQELSRSLKQLGAQHVQAGRNHGLTSRQRYTALTMAYEQYRQTKGLPATWQLMFAILKQPA